MSSCPQICCSPRLTSIASTGWIRDYKVVLESYSFRRPMCPEVSLGRKEHLQKLWLASPRASPSPTLCSPPGAQSLCAGRGVRLTGSHVCTPRSVVDRASQDAPSFLPNPHRSHRLLSLVSRLTLIGTQAPQRRNETFRDMVQMKIVEILNIIPLSVKFSFVYFHPCICDLWSRSVRDFVDLWAISAPNGLTPSTSRL